MLWQVLPLYFDDIEFLSNHKFAEELFAIHEFNKNNTEVKLDEWQDGHSQNVLFLKGFIWLMI
jgi:hypothetical protein